VMKRERARGEIAGRKARVAGCRRGVAATRAPPRG